MRASGSAARKSLPLPLLALALSGCVTLDLREATRPYVGRVRPEAPTIAVCEVRDRREDPQAFGRVGWNVFSFSGDAGPKLRNALLSALDEKGYNLRFVGPVNVLDRKAAAEAIEEAGADLLLTAAVLDIRVYSTDPFFDPADVDFVAQVNLLDSEGRTTYTRHLHAHEDRRLWFNVANVAMEMLDDAVGRVAGFVAEDQELKRALEAQKTRRARTAAQGPATEAPIAETPAATAPTAAQTPAVAEDVAATEDRIPPAEENAAETEAQRPAVEDVAGAEDRIPPAEENAAETEAQRPAVEEVAPAEEQVTPAAAQPPAAEDDITATEDQIPPAAENAAETEEQIPGQEKEVARPESPAPLPPLSTLASGEEAVTEPAADLPEGETGDGP